MSMRTKALPGIELENLLRPPLPPLVAAPLPPLVRSPLPAPVLLDLGRLDPQPSRVRVPCEPSFEKPPTIFGK
jgi:hypothetical protein